MGSSKPTPHFTKIHLYLNTLQDRIFTARTTSLDQYIFKPQVSDSKAPVKGGGRPEFNLGKIPEKEWQNPLQPFSFWQNLHDGYLWVYIHGVAKESTE